MITSVRERERILLDRLKENYEADGYQFFIEPPSDIVPKFLRSYRPDAIAIRADVSVIIEIKSTRSDREHPKLSQIAAAVAPEPHWKFVVYTLDEEDSANTLNAPKLDTLADRLQEIDDLIAKGFQKPAGIMSWSVLEGLHRIIATRDNQVASRPFSPIQTIQFLEMNGLVNYDEGKFLRDFVKIRNAVLHGDFGMDFSEGAVKFLRDVVKRVTAQIHSHSGR